MTSPSAPRKPSPPLPPGRDRREHQALLAARSLVDRMRRLYRELEQLSGAPIGMHRALNAIGECPGIQASQLATALGMKRPAISQVVNGMVERGWIERLRPKSDQRAVQLYPTSAGQKILRATAGRAVGMLQRAVRALTDEDLEHLAVALPALLAALPERQATTRGTPLAGPTRRPSKNKRQGKPA